jgi:hypothetical protein
MPNRRLLGALWTLRPGDEACVENDGGMTKSYFKRPLPQVFFFC